MFVRPIARNPITDYVLRSCIANRCLYFIIRRCTRARSAAKLKSRMPRAASTPDAELTPDDLMRQLVRNMKMLVFFEQENSPTFRASCSSPRRHLPPHPTRPPSMASACWFLLSAGSSVITYKRNGTRTRTRTRAGKMWWRISEIPGTCGRLEVRKAGG